MTPIKKTLQTKERIRRHRTLQNRLENLLNNLQELKPNTHHNYVPDLRELLELHTLINLTEFQR